MPTTKRTPSMTWAWLDDLLVVVARGSFDGEKADAKDSEEVDRFIKEASEHPFTTVLSISQGAPKANSVQRKELSNAFKGKKIVSVFDGSALTRGVITALGWLGMNIISFPLKEIDKAVVAAAPEGKGAQVMAEVRRLAALCAFKFD
jgi:hypothetical protein